MKVFRILIFIQFLVAVVVIPVSAEQLAMDDFTRSIATGWGNTNSGESWIIGSNPIPFSVNGNIGSIEVVPGAFSRKAIINTNSLHTEMAGKISWDSTVSSGYAFGGLLVRVNETRNNYYFASIRDINGFVNIVLYRVIANSSSVIANVNTPLTYYPGTQYYLRFIATGVDPTTLRVKVWPSAQTEPSSWTLIENDDHPEIQSAGATGIRAGIGGAAITSTFVNFDDLSVSNLTDNEVLSFGNTIQSVIDSGILTGPEGPEGPIGETGPQGPPGERGLAGLPTNSVAICSSSPNYNADCNCSGRTITKTRFEQTIAATSRQYCTALSDNGSCIGQSTDRINGNPVRYRGSGACCVCAAE